MVNTQEMMEAAKLRLRLQMNARLRLEVLAALSRVFREYNDPVSDELLSSLILAASDELIGEAQSPLIAHVSGPHDEAGVPVLTTPPPDPQPIPGPRPRNLATSAVLQNPVPDTIVSKTPVPTIPITKTPVPGRTPLPRIPVPKNPISKTPPPNPPVPRRPISVNPPPNPPIPRRPVPMPPPPLPKRPVGVAIPNPRRPIGNPPPLQKSQDRKSGPHRGK